MPDLPMGRLVICPSPPMLLPGATGREDVPERNRMLTEIRQAVQWLCEPGLPVLVLAAGSGGRVLAGTELDAAAFGLAYRTRLGVTGRARVAPRTPRTPGMLVAAAVLGQWPATGVEVADPDVAYEHAVAAGCTSVLVMGGGSARRRDGAPGYIDPRAVPYDDRLVELIADARADELREPDLPLADALLCDLARPLAVGARLAVGWGGVLRSRVDSYTAEYGVANIVARWWADG